MKVPCPRCRGAGYLHHAIGAQQRRRREAAGLSLRAMARHLGMGAMTLSHLERDHLPWTEEVKEQYDEEIVEARNL